jgi:hypothetical protein
VTPEDFTTFRTVHSILVRNYADTQKLDVDVIHSTVYIEGEFVLYENAVGGKRNDPIERDGAVKRTLLQVEKEIRRLTPADSVQFKLSNWDRAGARWVKKRGG